jgi:adenylate cyclase
MFFMNDTWQLRVYDDERAYVADLTGPAEIGRQQNREETAPAHFLIGETWRVVIAPIDDTAISRRHLSVKPMPDGRFQFTNTTSHQILRLAGGQEIGPGAAWTVSLPLMLQIGRYTLRFQAVPRDLSIDRLPTPTMIPGSGSIIPGIQAFAIQAADLMEWIQAFLGLLHSAAGSEDFFVKAARAVVDLVKLDSGRVLFRLGDDWRVEATWHATRKVTPKEWRPSSRILGSVLREKRTYWQLPDASASTMDVDAVVASPILDRMGNVIGALYGERRLGDGESQAPITQIEGMLVEVLASGVAAGLARLEQEQAALRTRLQMEQFMTARLAAKLEAHPELLQGRDTMISVLFCDIRGFSRITEQLGSRKTIEWLSDVMDALTQCVLDSEGVVVDYVGDAIMAIWGAPEDQSDHAQRACRTALAMLECVPRLNERWLPHIKEPLRLSIGINSGMAQVGNVGSSIKFKYGALGNTVNLANRVQGAVKVMKSPVLITAETNAGLDVSFATRRLAEVRVNHIDQPVTLYELAKPDSEWIELKRDYESALDEFSRGEFRQACRILGRLILEHPDDGPSLLLLARAVGCLVNPPSLFDPVMVLEGK